MSQLYRTSSTSLPRLIDSLMGHAWDIFTRHKQIDIYLIARATLQAICALGSVIFFILVIEDKILKRPEIEMSEHDVPNSSVPTSPLSAVPISSPSENQIAPPTESNTASPTAESKYSTCSSSEVGCTDTPLDSSFDSSRGPNESLSSLKSNTTTTEVLSFGMTNVPNLRRRGARSEYDSFLVSSSHGVDDLFDGNLFVFVFTSQVGFIYSYLLCSSFDFQLFSLIGAVSVTVGAAGTWLLPLVCQLLLSGVCLGRCILPSPSTRSIQCS